MTAPPAGALVWLDGSLVPRATASVSVDDLAFLYGAACFETMRAWGGVVFRLSRHLDRLDAGLRALGVRGRAPRSDLEAAIRRTLEANALSDARVRLTVSAGTGNGRPDLGASPRPLVLITAEPVAGGVAAPVSLIVASTRIDADRPLAQAKHANFLPYLLAAAEARRTGVESALVLNHSGHISEAATANLFAVRAGRLVTPPLSDGPLPGVTREVVLELAPGQGITCAEASMMPTDLFDAEEAFLTSSVAGLVPVHRIEGHEFPAVPGPVTRALAAAYAERIRVECGMSSGGH